MEIKRIIFSSDILRVGPDRLTNPQQINIEWIHSLFGEFLEQILGCKSIIITGNHDDGLLSRIDMYRHLDATISVENWAAAYDSEEGENAFIEEADALLAGSLFVTYEAPPYMLNALDKLNIPYIDLSIHPVRFLDDYMFGMRSNVEKIRKRIEDLSIDEFVFYEYAHIMKARSKRVFRGSLPNPSSALFLGQTEIDASLIYEGTMASLDEVMDTLTDLSANHETVYYKAHPHSKIINQIKSMVNSISQCRWIEVNIYDALSCDRFSCVYSLSSGSLYEAKYFGMKSKKILPTPDLFSLSGNQPKARTYLPMDSAILSQAAWKYIFVDIDIIDHDKSRFGLSPIKYMLNMKWGK